MQQKRQVILPVFFAGGANEVRTRDLLNAIQARYQLRHNPIDCF